MEFTVTDIIKSWGSVYYRENYDRQIGTLDNNTRRSTDRFFNFDKSYEPVCSLERLVAEHKT